MAARFRSQGRLQGTTSPGPSITAFAWCKRHFAGDPANVDFGAAISDWNTAGGLASFEMLVGRGAGHYFAIKASGGAYTQTPLTDYHGGDSGSWIPYAGSYDSTSQVLLAYSGNNWGITNRNASGVSRSAVATFNIGARAAGDDIVHFNGLIAHAALWSVALTAPEILALCRGVPPSRIRPASLYGYWPLKGDNMLFDASGNGRALTIQTGPVTPVADDPLDGRVRLRSVPKSAAAVGNISPPFIAGAAVAYPPTLTPAATISTIAGQAAAISGG